MAFDYYFINETKKQIISSKVVGDSFEDKEELLLYLTRCLGDTIRVVGENDDFINTFMHHTSHLKVKSYNGYKEVKLYLFSLLETPSDSELLHEEISNPKY